MSDQGYFSGTIVTTTTTESFGTTILADINEAGDYAQGVAVTGVATVTVPTAGTALTLKLYKLLPGGTNTLVDTIGPYPVTAAAFACLPFVLRDSAIVGQNAQYGLSAQYVGASAGSTITFKALIEPLTALDRSNF